MATQTAHCNMHLFRMPIAQVASGDGSEHKNKIENRRPSTDLNCDVLATRDMNMIAIGFGLIQLENFKALINNVIVSPDTASCEWATGPAIASRTKKRTSDANQSME